LLVEFGSVVDALRCAVEVQREMTGRSAGVPPDNRIELRIGINVGDIVVEDGDIFGDGVNVAARLEALAEPGGICVAARVQEDAAGKLDLVFEDIGEQQLKNIARPVRVFRLTPSSPLPTPPPHAGEGSADDCPRSLRLARPPPPHAGEGSARSARVGAAEPPALPLPDKPSIAVLPFQNLRGDAEQEYFVDGMVEEIITALSRIRWLFVLARNSSFIYKGQAVDVKQVGRELGVRYVLEGSVRKAGGRVRITAQLIDVTNGTHLWADRFDGALEDVFELQDKVAISVAGVIEPALQAAEITRSANRPTNDLAAYDLYLRALANFPWLRKEELLEARDLLSQAIARDPRYGPALAWAGICHYRLCFDGWAEDPVASRRQAVALAERALAVADDDPGVLTNAALVLGRTGQDISTAIALIDRSLALNPSSARGLYGSGFIRVHAGQYDAAIEHLEKSLRLSRRAYSGAPRLPLDIAHFFSGRFAQSAEILAMYTREGASATAYCFLASCYGHLRRLDEARAVIERLRAIAPDALSSNSAKYSNPEQRELFLSGLRLAMGETP
jgi:adenylate cyclase